MRIDKLLSNLKYGTRSEIKKALKNHLVEVNKEVILDPKYNVNPETDHITFRNEEVYYRDTILLMMNKPSGYVSANKDNLNKTVMELIKEPYTRFDLKIAGRLDKDTEGLLLLTNNGELIHNIISPNKDVYKKYFVRVDAGFDATSLLSNMEIYDGNDRLYIPKTPKVEQLSDTEFYLYIKEGKFHQVKRMCKYFDREVMYLKRVAVGDIELDENLQLGEYKEIERLN